MSQSIQFDPKQKDQLNQLSNCTKTAGSEENFSALLEKAQGLRFSNHAQKRIQNRQIELGDESLARLDKAVQKADKKGCRESLVLMDNLAFIVNVAERIIVTALDTQQRGEGVFTQIDSVVLADPE